MTKDELIQRVMDRVGDYTIREWLSTELDTYSSALLQQHDVSGALPDVELIRVIASKAYRQGCFHMDDLAAGMEKFNSWFDDEVKEMFGGNDR